ncbi:MAG: MbnP family copper-binding protein [Sphingomonas sp.]|jgi:uncharacterized repeat protein (TIGR04052 family)|uniref:MbnP family copper-binding protein n=1 Tax=Sphingomonas sp. TaxID=28214 RepID=UPI003567A0A9
MSIFLIAAMAAAAPAAATQPVTIHFAATVGARPFKCGESYAGVGTPAATITPTDFRFYVTNVELIDARGRKIPVKLDQDGLWQYRDVALLDFEDGSGPCSGGNSGLNLAVKGKVPAGRYVGMSFDVGLPDDLDHADASVAPAPLNFTSMFWVWQAGYRFFKVDMEGKFATMRPGVQTGFSVHIGSTDCGHGPMTAPPVKQCERPNRIAVTFAKFAPAKDHVTVDLAAILAGTDVTRNTPDTAPGCMSGQDDPECRGVFAAFGLPFGNVPVQPQTAFRKR